MAITVNQAANPNSFESTHIMHLKTFDNKEHITLSGIAKVELRNSEENLRTTVEDLKIIINLTPVLPNGKWFKMEQGVPIVTINSFSVKHGYSGLFKSDSGFQKGVYVDTFSIEEVGASWGIGLLSSIAVRYRSTVLNRVSYYVSMIGTFEDAAIIQ